MNPQILLYALTRAIGVANLPRTAEHLQGLTKFAKELYSAIHQLKNAAWGDGDGSGESSGRTSRKPKPSRLGGEGNEGGEEGGEREEKEEGKAFKGKNKDGSCKPPSFLHVSGLGRNYPRSSVMIRVKKSSEEQRNMELSSWNKQNQKSNHPNLREKLFREAVVA